MNIFIPLNDLILGDKSSLHSLCQTIVDPIDHSESEHINILVKYSAKYEKLNELLLYCYEHDYEFGYDNKYQHFFNKIFIKTISNFIE